jgi:hypothetical protein
LTCYDLSRQNKKKAWKVDRKVGNVKNDSVDCIEPMSEFSSDEAGLFT